MNKVKSYGEKVYYAALYTSEPPDDNSALDTFFHSLDIPKTDPDLSSNLEKYISVEEIIDAIRSMQCGKSPGPRWLPI